MTSSTNNNNKGVSFAQWIMEDEQTRTMRTVDSTAALSDWSGIAGETGGFHQHSHSSSYSSDNTWRWVLLGLCSGSAACAGVSLAVLGAAGRKTTFQNMLDINLTPKQTRILLVSNFLSVCFAGVATSGALTWFASRRNQRNTTSPFLRMMSPSLSGEVDPNASGFTPISPTDDELNNKPRSVSDNNIKKQKTGAGDAIVEDTIRDMSPISSFDATPSAAAADDDDDGDTKQQQQSTTNTSSGRVIPRPAALNPKFVQTCEEGTQTAGIPASPLSIVPSPSTPASLRSPLGSPLVGNVLPQAARILANCLMEEQGAGGGAGDREGHNQETSLAELDDHCAPPPSHIKATSPMSSPLVAAAAAADHHHHHHGSGSKSTTPQQHHHSSSSSHHHHHHVEGDDEHNVNFDGEHNHDHDHNRSPSHHTAHSGSHHTAANAEELAQNIAVAFVPHALKTIDISHRAAVAGGGNGTIMFDPNSNNSNRRPSLGPPGMMGGDETPTSPDLMTPPAGGAVLGGGTAMIPRALSPTSVGSASPLHSPASSTYAAGSHTHHHTVHGQYKWWDKITSANACPGTVLVLHIGLKELNFTAPVMGEGDKQNVDAVSRLVSVALDIGDSYGAVIDHFNLHWVVMSFNVLKPCLDHERSAAHCALAIRTRFIQMSAHANYSPDASPTTVSSPGSMDGSPLTNPSVKPLIPFAIGIDRGLILSGHVGNGSVLRSFVLHGATVSRAHDLAWLGSACFPSMSPILVAEGFNDLISAHCSSLLCDFVEFDCDTSGRPSYDTHQEEYADASSSPDHNGSAPAAAVPIGGEDQSPQPRQSVHHHEKKKYHHVVNVFDLYEEFHEHFSRMSSPASGGGGSMSPESSNSAFLQKDSSSFAVGGDYDELRRGIIADYTAAVTCLRSGSFDHCLDLLAALEGKTMAAFTTMGGAPVVSNDSLGGNVPPTQPIGGDVIGPATGARMPVWLYQVKRHVSRLRRNAQGLLASGLEGTPFCRRTQSRWSILDGVDDTSPTATPLLIRQLDIGAFSSGSRDTSMDMNGTFRSVKLGETIRSTTKRRLEDSPARMIAALQHQASAQRPGSELRSPNRQTPSSLMSPERGSSMEPGSGGDGSGSAGSGEDHMMPKPHSGSNVDSSGGGGGGGSGDGLQLSASQLFLPRAPSPLPELFQDLAGTWYRMSQKILGTGAFGAVRLGIRPVDGVLVAMKTLSLIEDEETDLVSTRRRRAQKQQQASSPEPVEAPVTKLDRIIAEVRLLASLRHQNVVSLLNCAVAGDNVILVLEFVSGGSLESLMKNFGGGGFDVPSTQRYLKDVLRGLRFLHERGFIHRDVKPANVLMHIDGSCKLADLGSGIAVKETLKKPKDAIQGTPYYMSPEACRGKVVFASDIWAVGIVACQLVSGQIPLKIAQEGIEGQMGLHRLLYHLMNEEVLFEFPDVVLSDPNLLSFVEQCLKTDAKDRPTAEQLLMHPFLMQQMRNRDVVSSSPSASRRRGGSRNPHGAHSSLNGPNSPSTAGASGLLSPNESASAGPPSCSTTQ